MRRNYKQLLEQYYNTNSNKQNIEQKLYSKYGTNKKCLKCGRQLLISDLKQYKYLCLNCDENFYSFETLDSNKSNNGRNNNEQN